MSSITPLECVAFMLIERDRVLAEKRKKRLGPGAIAYRHVRTLLDLDVDRAAVEAYVRSRTAAARP